MFIKLIEIKISTIINREKADYIIHKIDTCIQS